MSESSTIDPETADWLTLDEGEEVVWSGKPHENDILPGVNAGEDVMGSFPAKWILPSRTP